jgi:hypothetical protein
MEEMVGARVHLLQVVQVEASCRGMLIRVLVPELTLVRVQQVVLFLALHLAQTVGPDLKAYILAAAREQHLPMLMLEAVLAA